MGPLIRSVVHEVEHDPDRRLPQFVTTLRVGEDWVLSVRSALYPEYTTEADVADGWFVICAVGVRHQVVLLNQLWNGSAPVVDLEEEGV